MDASDVDPPYLFPDYVGTRLRAPTEPLLRVQPTLTELSSQRPWGECAGTEEHDLTRGHAGAAIGERIIVAGQVTDTRGRTLSRQQIELWQCNAAGRYRHDRDQHPAPLDPNFTGVGRCLSNTEGWYRFVTIKPAAYPWQNHPNAWRPAHLHFSLFGDGLVARLVTQMYFPGDPLLAHDPIYRSMPNRRAADALVAKFDFGLTEPGWALGYRFDIVLRAVESPPMDET